MFISTLGLGMLPQILKIDQKYMSLMSIYGGGLLVGAALIIIVPEGIKVLIGSYKKTSLDDEDIEAAEYLAGDSDIDTEGLGHCIGISMACGFALMLLFDELCSSKKKKTINHEQMRNILNNDSLTFEEKQM
jgi:hypothetical protein